MPFCFIDLGDGTFGPSRVLELETEDRARGFAACSSESENSDLKGLGENCTRA